MFTKPNFRQRLVSLLCALMATFAGGMAYAEEAPVTYTAISGTAGFQGESYENMSPLRKVKFTSEMTVRNEIDGL